MFLVRDILLQLPEVSLIYQSMNSVRVIEVLRECVIGYCESYKRLEMEPVTDRSEICSKTAFVSR